MTDDWKKRTPSLACLCLSAYRVQTVYVCVRFTHDTNKPCSFLLAGSLLFPSVSLLFPCRNRCGAVVLDVGMQSISGHDRRGHVDPILRVQGWRGVHHRAQGGQVRPRPPPPSLFLVFPPIPLVILFFVQMQLLRTQIRRYVGIGVFFVSTFFLIIYHFDIFFIREFSPVGGYFAILSQPCVCLALDYFRLFLVSIKA